VKDAFEVGCWNVTGSCKV